MAETYRMRLRPVSGVNLPDGTKWRWAELPAEMAHLSERLGVPAGATRYGTFTTEVPLTDAQLHRYDIDRL